MAILTEKPTYAFPSGTVVNLKPVPPFLIHAVAASTKGAPKPPLIEVKIAGKLTREENRNDSNYLAALSDFESDRNLRTMQLLFNRGVEGTITDYYPDNSPIFLEIESLTETIYGPDYTLDQLKYTWLSSELIDSDVAEDFQNAIQELTIPSESAIEDSKSSV